MLSNDLSHWFWVNLYLIKQDNMGLCCNLSDTGNECQSYREADLT